jgi:hypothetical protein
VPFSTTKQIENNGKVSQALLGQSCWWQTSRGRDQRGSCAHGETELRKHYCYRYRVEKRHSLIARLPGTSGLGESLIKPSLSLHPLPPGGVSSPTATLFPKFPATVRKGPDPSHADRNLFRDPQLGVYPLHLCIVGHTFARAEDRILQVSERTRSSDEETIPAYFTARRGSSPFLPRTFPWFRAAERSPIGFPTP